MKNLYFVLGLSFFSVLPNSLHAKNICPVNENIAEDMRIGESEFNEEKAKASLAYLTKLVNDPKTQRAWFSIPNSTKFIEGFVLKRAATAPNANQFVKEEFCKFMEKQAWYYD